MVEFDGTVEVVGADGPVPFLDLFQGRDELVVYHSMWYDGAPICWYWRSDADGNATWGPTSRPVPQWTRPGATPVETLGRHGHH